MPTWPSARRNWLRSSGQHRMSDENCRYNLRVIADGAAGHAHMVGVELSEHTILIFVHAALSLANIKLPHPDERRRRLRKLVYGEVRLHAAPSPSEG